MTTIHTTKRETPKQIVATFLAQRAAQEWYKWLRWADTHCWHCDAEVGDYEYGDKCPNCGTDLVPF
jgi:hypothetical protein